MRYDAAVREPGWTPSVWLGETAKVRRLDWAIGLVLGCVLCACESKAPSDDDMMMQVTQPPPAGTGMCAAGQRFTCFCMGGGTGMQMCLADGSMSPCMCVTTPPRFAECQPGTRVVCECSPGVGGNHLCLPDATFEPCMCEGQAPSDAGPTAEDDAG